MKSRNTRNIILIAICLIITASLAIALSKKDYDVSAKTNSQEKVKKQDLEKEEIPTVNFTRQELKQREIKRSAHDKPIEEMAGITDVTSSDSAIERTPALPVEKSDIIAIGTVTQAEAHLTSDKSNVYSEYTINIEEVLDNKTTSGLAFGNTLTAMREGGRVQFDSGHVQTYRLSGAGFLKVNRKYLFFLKQNKETQDYLLLTGYQLKKGEVVPVDQITSQKSYEGTTETEFISTVRNAVASAGKRGN